LPLRPAYAYPVLKPINTELISPELIMCRLYEDNSSAVITTAAAVQASGDTAAG